ncbi:MAG TPA: carboxypeptidase-like regulatory domain-containing protein, partial [Chryseolinea sp.]|nr:carboxypeptidase-like regulatory domain-containing protein [Chryseolinea sp.]
MNRKLPILLGFLVLSLAGLAQTQKIRGRVSSGDDGSVLPGVSIIEKGTSNGTVTDGEGNFALDVGKDAVLVFS